MNHHSVALSRGADERAAEVLTYIKDYVLKHGYAPSIREIVQGMNLSSTSVANSYVARLIRARKLARKPGKSRALIVLGAETPGVPGARAVERLSELQEALQPLAAAWKTALQGKADAGIFMMTTINGHAKPITNGYMRSVLALLED